MSMNKKERNCNLIEADFYVVFYRSIRYLKKKKFLSYCNF